MTTNHDPGVTPLSIDVLILDAGTQSRESISDFTVAEYTEVLAKSGQWPFPPLDVFHDGNRYLLAAGFHRTLAASRLRRSSVPCIIHQGTAKDALMFGIDSNIQHGLRPSQADKRHAVELLLDSGDKLTQKAIADSAGVTERTVRRIVAERRVAASTKGTIAPADEPEEMFDDPIDYAWDTELNGQDAQTVQEHAPRPPGSGTDVPGGTPRDPFKTQRSKTIKTAQALVRAFDDLDDLMSSRDHEATISACQDLMEKARDWP